MKNVSSLLFIFFLILFACTSEDSIDSYNTDDFSLSADSNRGNTTGTTSNPPTGDNYAEIEENPFIKVSDEAISTFSIDADGASYANVRRFLQQDDKLPPKAAIRTEELINYFNLDYYNNNVDPISLNGEVSVCPWNEDHKLVRVGIKGKHIPESELSGSNFVFLIDVSGSMSSDDKLPLLKEGFKRFVDIMSVDDRVAIVVYAGEAGVLLESTPGTEKEKIKSKIDQLGAGGSTAGSEGIITAYEIAQQNFIPGGNNRIIIGTDGDFNVGIYDFDKLIELIEEKREEEKVFITVLGVGRGNYQDHALEQIANRGNGTFEYIDKLEQLNKVFLFERNKFYAVAKDVKVQIEFNPSLVQEYRLIGYENRLLETEDFEDDTKDAGEIGADQNITALYEIIPARVPTARTVPSFSIDFRYKLPESDVSVPLALDIFDEGNEFHQSSDFMQFTASIAAFSQLLRDSDYKGDATYDKVLSWLNKVNLSDQHDFKEEFQRLVKRADELSE